MSNFYREIQQATIDWFHNYQRQDLPWRQPLPFLESNKTTLSSSQWVPNPYYIWISEVMSQQTQMDTVIRYFQKWIHLFPTVKDLAKASEESVKAAWSGMGYYRRAILLKKGAEYIVQHFDGKLPSTASQLMHIPSIGPYTAAAVASICFGEKIISVDGNVVRVLSRLRCEKNFDPKIPKNIKTVIQWGQELMIYGPCENPSALNQGLMEIGARVCKPAGPPLCEECPLKNYCKAYNARKCGEINAIEGIIPLKAASIKKRKEIVICVVHEFYQIKKEEKENDYNLRRFVVLQRPEEGLLGGMLEFPSATYGSSDDILPKEDKFIIKFREKLDAGHNSVQSIGSIRHIFSHIDMEVIIYHAVWFKSNYFSGKTNLDVKVKLSKNSSIEREVCESLAEGLNISSSRIYIKTEKEIKDSAASRLLLKILQKIPVPTEEGNLKITSVKKRIKKETN